MENLVTYIIMGVLLLTLLKLISNASKKSNVVIPYYNNENLVDTSQKKKWTKDEFMVLAFYSLYEREGKNDEEVINSIAIATCRSYASVYKKVVIFNNIENISENLNKLEREVYNDFKGIGEEASDLKVCKAIENIIEINKQ